MTDSLSIKKVSASPTQVRQWLRDNDYIVGERGKFSAEQIAAYNAVHKGFASYKPAAFKPVKVATVRVKGKDRKVPVMAARNLLREAGETVGKRGRLTKDQVQRALELAK